MAEITALALKAKLAALAKNPPGKVVRIMAGGGLHLLVKPTHAAGAGVPRPHLARHTRRDP